MTETFILKIYRGSQGCQYWEEFELQLKPRYNLIAALMDVQQNPVTREGKRVAPVAWEQGCLEEVCGSCTMLVNGRPRQACTALIEPLLQSSSCRTITVAPLTKYPLVRDLVVDREQLFASLQKVRAWVVVEEKGDQGPGPKISQEKQQTIYQLATCMTCGCCSEACPQVNSCSEFMGPAPIAQARLFNEHPEGEKESALRLRSLMEPGGVADCGNAQNCAKVCPKNIPLTESIAAMGGAVSKQAIKDLFGVSDE